MFDFDVTGFDSDTDWFCDMGHSHPYATFIEENGDPCPYEQDWYGLDEAELGVSHDDEREMESVASA